MSTANESTRRRVFAIISHPDAGKTTLTENMLFAAGAIHQAGQVAARGERRRTQSDWMKNRAGKRDLCVLVCDDVRA